MRVRLTRISDGADLAVHGAAASPPTPGKAFSVLLMSEERLVVTETVDAVWFDHFVTEDGDTYSWSLSVGEA